MVNWPEVVGFQAQTVVVKLPENVESINLKLWGLRLKDQLAKVEIQLTKLVIVVNL